MRQMRVRMHQIEKKRVGAGTHAMVHNEEISVRLGYTITRFVKRGF